MYILTFRDGPAEGAQLWVARAPIWLRVVRELDGRIDCLDQLDDLPNLGDTIHIYRRGPTLGHVSMTPRKNSAWMIEYEQTDWIAPEGMDDPERWQAAARAASERQRREEPDEQQQQPA